MSTEIVPLRKKVETFRSTLEQMKGQLAMALPAHIKPDRIVRILMTAVQKTPLLLECTRESLFGAIIECSQLGLEPGGGALGQAYLIPFKNNKTGRYECQLIPGYKGLIKLAYQSGEVGSVRARIVRQKDLFSYKYGLSEELVHEPHRGEDAGELVAVYAVARLTGIPDPQFLVMERWEVEKVRERSRAAKSGPWVTDFEEMAKKTALRRLVKLLPASVEKDNLARAVALGEQEEAGMSQEFSDFIDISASPVDEAEEAAPAPAPKSKLDELAERTKKPAEEPQGAA